MSSCLPCVLSYGLLCRWEHLSNLEWHTSPVLSLASVALPGTSPAKSGSPGHLVVSGATDGSMALWHLQLPGSAAGPDQAAAEMRAERLLCMPSLHQSGVNAVSVSALTGVASSFVLSPMGVDGSWACTATHWREKPPARSF